jgi:hypothetical protein
MLGIEGPAFGREGGGRAAKEVAKLGTVRVVTLGAE